MALGKKREEQVKQHEREIQFTVNTGHRELSLTHTPHAWCHNTGLAIELSEPVISNAKSTPSFVEVRPTRTHEEDTMATMRDVPIEGKPVI